MTRKVFISFLGTNDYVECHYELNGKQSPSTRFVQEALIDILCKDWTKNDEIIIFGTESSSQKNWFDGGQKKNDELQSKGLQSILQSKNLDVKINDITLIPEGFSEDEIWQIFNIVYGKIQENDEIYFDVTHAFRSIPMFSTILLNYAKMLKKSKLISIHYGAFEKLGPAFEVKTMPIEQRIAPILNLTNLINLQDWIVAASDFIDYGKTNKIHNLLEEKYRALNKEMSGKNQDSKALEMFDKALVQHSEEIVSNNLDNIITGTGIKKELNAVKTAQTAISPAFVPLIEKIEDKLEAFKQNDMSNIFAATRWCIQHELYQNAYSILLEGTISITLHHCIDADLSDENIRNMPTYISDNKSKRTFDERWNEYTIKKNKNKDDYKEIFECLWNVIDNETAKTIEKLNRGRNSYMHAGTETPINFGNLKKNIDDCVCKLEDWYAQLIESKKTDQLC